MVSNPDILGKHFECYVDFVLIFSLKAGNLCITPSYVWFSSTVFIYTFLSFLFVFVAYDSVIYFFTNKKKTPCTAEIETYFPAVVRVTYIKRDKHFSYIVFTILHCLTC